MGLFSFLGKNKQDSSLEPGGRFSGGVDDAFAEKARSKRASHAGEGARRGRGADDPVLPEKKRARRRLVGSIALALAAAVGLPMLLDSEPKPLAGDIAIQIPSKEKAPPLPMPANPAPVQATDSVDQGEEIVEPAPGRPQAAQGAPEPARAVAEVKATPPAKAEPHPEPPKPEPKVAKVEPKPVEKHVELKVAEKQVDKPAEKPVKPKAEEKPAKADDAARAMAILEGKPAAPAGGKFVLQVAALGSQEKAAELQARLRDAGIRAYTEKVARPGGDLIRVKVGPFSKDEAEKVRAQLSKLGLSGSMVPV